MDEYIEAQLERRNISSGCTSDRDRRDLAPRQLLLLAAREITRLRAEVADLKCQLAEAKQLRRDDPNERLHLMCELLSQQADESPFTKAEWDRIDQENIDLKRQLAEAKHWLESRETELRTAQESLGKAYAKLALAREENLSLRQREAKA